MLPVYGGGNEKELLPKYCRIPGMPGTSTKRCW